MFLCGARLAALILACAWFVTGATIADSNCTVYVDARSPYCSDPAVGTIERPYCSISAALRDHGVAGAEIVVRPGIYREQVILPSGGLISPLVLRASGPGVVIEGADDLSETSRWTRVTGDVWLAPSVTWRPRQVFSDGARLTASSADTASLAVSSFKYVHGQGLYVRVSGNPGATELLVGRRPFGFELPGGRGVRVEGFTVQHADLRGFQIANVRDVVLAGDTVAFSFSQGVLISDAEQVRVERCRIADNGNHGIFLQRTHRSQVLECEALRNTRLADPAANGIHLRESSENLLRGNRVHENQDTGIHIQTESNQNVSVNNLAWDNGDHGFDVLRAHGTLLIGGTTYGNRNDGVSVEGGATGTRIFNVISHDNGIDTNHYDLFVDSLSTAGFESNDNVIWNSTSQRPIRYHSVSYSTVNAFTTATGHDSRSIDADPQFVSPGSGDFRLRSSSPAIDSGNSEVSTLLTEDALGRLRFDVPSRNNVGIGPIPYIDRGALEYNGVEKTVIVPGPVVRFALSPPVPNPTDGSVRLELELPVAGVVDYRVLDVAGREVFRSQESRPAGRSVVCWYGNRGDGTRMKPGIYIADVRAAGHSFQHRITLLR